MCDKNRRGCSSSGVSSGFSSIVSRIMIASFPNFGCGFTGDRYIRRTGNIYAAHWSGVSLSFDMRGKGGRGGGEAPAPLAFTAAPCTSEVPMYTVRMMLVDAFAHLEGVSVCDYYGRIRRGLEVSGVVVMCRRTVCSIRTVRDANCGPSSTYKSRVGNCHLLSCRLLIGFGASPLSPLERACAN